MRNVWKNGKNVWNGKYRNITSWICSNMEMESHILGTRLISAEERTLNLLSLFFVNVTVVTTLKINCKAQGKGKGEGRCT